MRILLKEQYDDGIAELVVLAQLEREIRPCQLSRRERRRNQMHGAPGA